VAAAQVFPLLSEIEIVLPAPESHVTAATRRSPAVVVMALADREEASPLLEPLAAWTNEIVAAPCDCRGRHQTAVNKNIANNRVTIQNRVDNIFLLNKLI
jgi:hypothetical protein